jgi:hypothetical protein
VANRDNHYEAAFEAYLRDRGISYVAVDEARRSPLAGASLKSLDFIVSPAAAPGEAARSWLVDIKGRRFPSGAQQQYFKNWSTQDDLWSLARWEQLFGRQFGGLFVFAYHVVGSLAPVSPQRLFAFRGGLYGFVGIRLADYARHSRPISARWDTVAMSARRFRALAAPVEHFWGTNGNSSPAAAGPEFQKPVAASG